MQRNVIQLSSTSAGMSLPSKWLKKWNLKKGDNIHIEEKNGVLEIKPSAFKPEEKKVEIDASKYKELIGRKVVALTRHGNDEIIVRNYSQEQLKIIREYMQKELTSFEIIKKEKDYLVIKVITEISAGEVQNIIRKLISLLLEDISKVREYMESYDNSLLDDILEYENILNKLSTSCSRALCKYYDKEYTKFTFVWLLEKIGDDFKFFSHNKIKNIKPETKKILEKLLDNLEVICKLYLNYDGEKARNFYSKRKELVEICLKEINKRNDPLLFHHILSMNEKGMYMLGLIIGTN